MEMSIAQKTKEPLLSRMRVSGNLVFESKTPSNQEVGKAIASAVKSDEKLVVVKRISTAFGARKAAFEACVYDDHEAMTATEPHPRKKEGAQEKKEEKA